MNREYHLQRLQRSGAPLLPVKSGLFDSLDDPQMDRWTGKDTGRGEETPTTWINSQQREKKYLAVLTACKSVKHVGMNKSCTFQQERVWMECKAVQNM